MIRVVTLVSLLLLAACSRNQAALTPDADAETRAATAAKTLADIAAAEDASRTPLVKEPPRRATVQPAEKAEDAPPAEPTVSPGNETKLLP